MKTILHDPEGTRLAECGNCHWQGTESRLRPIENLGERIDPGGLVPLGECPKCGALAYLQADKGTDGHQTKRLPRVLIVEDCDDRSLEYCQVLLLPESMSAPEAEKILAEAMATVKCCEDWNWDDAAPLLEARGLHLLDFHVAAESY